MVFRRAAEARSNADANADPAPANHNPLRRGSHGACEDEGSSS
jgi:hypothetical protein